MLAGSTISPRSSACITAGAQDLIACAMSRSSLSPLIETLMAVPVGGFRTKHCRLLVLSVTSLRRRTIMSLLE
jgi:hypothetical protein